MPLMWWYNDTNSRKENGVPTLTCNVKLVLSVMPSTLMIGLIFDTDIVATIHMKYGF